MAEEFWKPVSGYDDLYEVSNLGRVKSLDRVYTYDKHYKDKTVVATHHFKGKVLSTGNNSGYLSVVLSKDGVTQTCLVHRLVAEAFLDNPENKPQVNHLDGDHQNNRADNLEWATEKENQQHAVRIGIHSRSNHKSRIAVMCVDTGQIFQSMSEADRWLKCPYGKVSQSIIANQRVRGYKFKKC